MCDCGTAAPRYVPHMRYVAYDLSSSMTDLSLQVGDTTSWLWRSTVPWVERLPQVRLAEAARETVKGIRLTHTRPDFMIPDVREVVVDAMPFGDLLHFERDGNEDGPPVIVVAALSGHFATLARDTVEGLLDTGHDVYVTDWRNARDVPLADGRFGLDEYVDYLLRWVRRFDGDVHLVGVCQSAPAVLTAVSLLSQDDDPAVPRSMTLMAGPVDTRRGTTRVTDVAGRLPKAWFERAVIMRVPPPHAGVGRRVYPGFLQVGAFMSMNAGRHRSAQFDIFRAYLRKQEAETERSRQFYAEYFAVLDATAEFYVDTVERIFRRHELPLGTATHHGRSVDPSAITRTRLLTVEGENDDMCGPGQTEGAQDLCTSLSDDQREHHVQEGVGHYGVFSGSGWREGILPRVAATIAAAA